MGQARRNKLIGKTKPGKITRFKRLVHVISTKYGARDIEMLVKHRKF